MIKEPLRQDEVEAFESFLPRLEAIAPLIASRSGCRRRGCMGAAFLVAHPLPYPARRRRLATVGTAVPTSR